MKGLGPRSDALTTESGPFTMWPAEFKGRTIRKVMGGMGDFQLARLFLFAHCLCRNFFYR